MEFDGLSDLEVRSVGGVCVSRRPASTAAADLGPMNMFAMHYSNNSPTEQATWPAGVVPTGSYEILVYYQPLDAADDRPS
jgi:hypothetical protein